MSSPNESTAPTDANDSESAKAREPKAEGVTNPTSVADTKPGRLWTFLNSSFGMWLISVAVFGTALKWFTEEAKKNDEATKVREEARAKDLDLCSTIARLDLEAGYRLTQVQEMLYEASKIKTSNGRTKVGLEVLDMLRRAPSTKGDLRYLSLYPQYSGYGLPALVAELRRLEETPIQINCLIRSPWEGHKDVPSKSTDRDTTQQRVRELQEVLAHLTGLPTFFEVRHVNFDQPERMAGEVVEELALNRWKFESGWYFLEEGSRATPFP
jgi:hypothetical protein